MESISTAEEQENLIIQHSIKYLDTLTSLRKLNVPTLKSLYRTKCRLMELRRHIFLPVKPFQRCQRCFMNFKEGDTSYEIAPCKLPPFANKVLQKLKKNQALTDYQKAYYKKLLKKFPKGFQDQNQLVLTCNFCKNETKVVMTKPRRQRQVKAAKTKKKSKKNDKFCGLNESVVLLSSTKKKLQSSNNNTSLESIPVTTGTMANRRLFETMPKTPAKKKNAIKLAKKKENVVTKVVAPVMSKAKVKLNKKKLNNLSQLLEKSVSGKSRQPPRLKDFLASL